MNYLDPRLKGQEDDIVINDGSCELDKNSLASMLLSKRARQTMAACIIGAMLAGGSIYYYNYRNTGYAVRYQGSLLGYVRDIESAKQALESVKADINNYDPTINVSDDLTFEKLLVNDNKLISSEYIKDIIENDLLLRYTCYSIFINGSAIAVVKNEEEANKVIEGIKQYITSLETKDGAELISLTIIDEITTEKKVLNTAKISDAHEVIDMLMAGKGTTKKYQVKKGDSIWQIAKSNNMTISEIAAVNPGLNVDRLQIGQEINLSVSEPYINYEAKVKVAENQNIPFNTTYVSDSNLYRGETKVLKSGEYGINKVTKEITKANGVEVASTVLSTELVKEPVTRVMARGTKQLIGSGKFKWPVNGVISSAFGSRWGGFHRGLDIAAPYGSAIYAADGGTVVHSGWYSNYGKLVIIDHGNGYTTYYGHCSSLFVSAGDTVTKGQKIAAVGMTGQATGPHVHFEVRKNGVHQNPINYLK